MKNKTIEEQIMELTKDIKSIEGVALDQLGQNIEEALQQAEARGAVKERERIQPFVERVRLDVDVIVCDCGEPYKNSDLDLSVSELEQTITNKEYSMDNEIERIRETKKRIEEIKTRLRDKELSPFVVGLWKNQIKMLENDLNYYKTGRIHF